MRPNSPTQQSLVRHVFRGSAMYIYAVPPGTELPEDFILVHEFGDHYLMQARKDMSIDELNTKITDTDFLGKKAQSFRKEEWLQRYLAATEFA
ncbi:hypothetical protein IEO21_01628 [Rhodonia placenta]|uniref:Tse2 ADP-ribosyltransferase toxin domain-containing protein n=1 Tax=Rhodonia placenta TaxID=104341 RepID=A0A8H7P989_9APHY|nr:hypothetical protein IEO21_01628 [Postia placenta]